MKPFTPPGYRSLADLRDELGPHELRNQLASGRRKAFVWDRRDSVNPLQEIPASRWLAYGAEGSIKTGFATPYPFATWSMPILIAEVKVRKGYGGRPDAANWEALEAALRTKVQELGFPERGGNKGWRTRADARVWAERFLRNRNQEVGDTTLRDHVSAIFAKLKEEIGEN